MHQFRPDGIVFDLDGTLWDSCDTCAEGWNSVIITHRIDFRPITGDDVRSVAGLPHSECIQRIFTGLPKEDIEILSRETAKIDNQMIEKKGGVLYPGVAEGLKRLAKLHRLFIVSNCQAGYIENFFAKTGFKDLFEDFECWGNTGKPKADNLRNLVDRNQLLSPVYIGDTEGDFNAATENQIPFYFVEYGFGQVPSAHQRFTSFPELVELILS